jgi:hypothetical protein
MSKLMIFVSATIVLILLTRPTWASPQNEAPPDSPTTEESTGTAAAPLPADMQVSKPPVLRAPPPPGDAHYYPYQQQLTFRYGRGGDFPKIRLNDNVTGFQYMFPKFLSPKLEAGADLHDDGNGHVHLGARWIHNERGYFRPSLKAAGDILIKGSENMATFAKIDNYFLRTSAALEQTVWNPYSLRFETELLFGSKNTILELTLGFSCGW